MLEVFLIPFDRAARSQGKVAAHQAVLRNPKAPVRQKEAREVLQVVRKLQLAHLMQEKFGKQLRHQKYSALL